jgi:hypothetical protein
MTETEGVFVEGTGETLPTLQRHLLQSLPHEKLPIWDAAAADPPVTHELLSLHEQGDVAQLLGVQELLQS